MMWIVRASLALTLLSACAFGGAPPPTSTTPSEGAIPTGASEAYASLEAIAARAQAMYRQRGAMCATASASVPSFVGKVQGTTYQSVPDDWMHGDETLGFGCLHFSISTPQRFMYTYVGAPDSKTFVARAVGFPNGDAQLVEYTIRGAVGLDGGFAVGPVVETPREVAPR
jgi:hypothetical protein